MAAAVFCVRFRSYRSASGFTGQRRLTLRAELNRNPDVIRSRIARRKLAALSAGRSPRSLPAPGLHSVYPRVVRELAELNNHCLASIDPLGAAGPVTASPSFPGHSPRSMQCSPWIRGTCEPQGRSATGQVQVTILENCGTLPYQHHRRRVDAGFSGMKNPPPRPQSRRSPEARPGGGWRGRKRGEDLVPG